MNEPVAWMNGRLQPFAQTALPVWDLGVVAGAAVTEMARTFGHQPFRLEQHLQRLLSSCHSLGFPVPYSLTDLLQAATEVVAQNLRLISESQDLGIVAFITAGTNATYLGGQPSAVGTTVIHTFPLPFRMWRKALTQGVRLRIPTVRQLPEDCLPVTHKLRNRLHWWLADREAERLEPGSRALLLDQQDCLTETSTSCFFAVLDQTVVTPDRQVLDSMSRRVVEELLHQLQIPCRRGPVPVQQLPNLQEAFLSSTPVCLLPVSHINGQPVGNGQPGPVFQQLLERWSQTVGVNLRAQILQDHPAT